jgi:hypothetical protein
MAITPDTKDWTWVLERPCTECGWDTRKSAVDRAGPTARCIGQAWVEVLSGGSVHERPRPGTWSPLEYGCHVRDVFRIGVSRLRLMVEEHEPTFPNWDQDATALEDAYPSQDPVVVTGELLAAAEQTASLLDALAPTQLDNGGLRSDGARFTVASFTRYLLHDPVHHLHDVGAPFRP